MESLELGTQALTVAQAADRLGSAIETARLWGQHAPGGHPIFAAIADAEEVADELRDLAGIEGPVVAPGTRTFAAVANVLDELYTAGSTLRNDPDAPLPVTAYPSVARNIPWPWIAGGLALVGGAALLFHSKGRR